MKAKFYVIIFIAFLANIFAFQNCSQGSFRTNEVLESQLGSSAGETGNSVNDDPPSQVDPGNGNGNGDNTGNNGNTGNIGGGTGGGSGSTNTSNFQLPAGNFEPSRIPMEIIAPRAGLNAQNRYYKTYPGLLYRVPVVVLGGAWPFRYTLVNAPTGMTIGSQLGDANYGIIQWANPTAQGSPHAVTIEVQDQEGQKRSVAYAIQVTTSGFIFIDANASSGGSGTYASPYRSIGEWYGGSNIDAKNATTYPYHFVYFRAGTYNLNSIYVESNSIVMNSDRKPTVFMGYPNEKITLDMARGNFWFAGNNIWLSNITFLPKTSSSDGAKVASWDSGQQDIVVFENIFSAATSQVGTNASLMFSINNPSHYTQYFSVVKNTFDGTGGNRLFLGYYTDKCVFENNRIDRNTSYGFYAKTQNRNWSIRNNVGLTANTGSLLDLSDYGIAQNIHLSWNNYRSTGEGLHLAVGNSTSTAITLYSGRNTWQIGSHFLQIRSLSGVNTHADVTQFTSALANTLGWVLESHAAISGSFTNTELTGRNTSFVDNNGKLLPAYENYLGRRGHQVIP